jgi:hypothetical protein
MIFSSEETLEDLRAYMHAIQENEFHQLQELTALIDVELNFAQSYLNVLKEVKADFHDKWVVTRSIPILLMFDLLYLAFPLDQRIEAKVSDLPNNPLLEMILQSPSSLRATVHQNQNQGLGMREVIRMLVPRVINLGPNSREREPTVRLPPLEDQAKIKTDPGE